MSSSSQAYRDRPQIGHTGHTGHFQPILILVCLGTFFVLALTAGAAYPELQLQLQLQPSAVAQHAPPASPTASCTPGPGQVVQPPPYNGQAPLDDVAAISANDVWAVGSYSSFNGETRGLIMHWDGSHWSTVPGPSGLEAYGLVAVDGVAANDVWAIGNVGGNTTLTIHWNGTIWSRVASPNESDGYSYLEDMDAISANDVWAVGYYSNGYFADNFAMHWDGSQWSIVPTPNPTGNSNYLHSVSGLSANDVWAVGEANQGATPVTLHWDGSQWTSVPAPNTGPGGTILYAVGMVASNDVWAMGYAQYGPSAAIIHWDGTAWSVTSAPLVQGIPREIKAISANDVWAVGNRGPQMVSPSIVAHWDGVQWLPVSLPDGLYNDILLGVTASSSSDVWAVGQNTYRPGSNSQPLVLRYFSAPCGSPTYTPSPTNTPVPTPPACGAGSNYALSYSTGAMFPGMDLVAGSQCNGCIVNITLPFTYDLYGHPYNSALLGSNGVINFAGSQNDPFNECLPDVGSQVAIFPYWDHLVMSPTFGSNLGIYTSVTGAAPNRVFNIEWRACRYGFGSCGGYINFEARLYEGMDRFDVILGQQDNTQGSATIGVQGDAQRGLFTSEDCDLAASGEGASWIFTINACPTPTPTATPGTCNIEFSDVPPGSTFYPYVHCLVCRGIINGYPDGTFRPNAQVTRGQLSKIVANAAGFTDAAGGQQFEDIAPGSAFYPFIWRLANRGYISGYACGGVGEPCGPGSLPYFRPGKNATRGQISKIVANAANLIFPPSGQQFEDVAVGSTYYTYTYRLASRGVMSGYTCGGLGEPCVPPANLPYFRPNNNATRGQTSKIVSNTFFPYCQIRIPEK